MEIDSFFGKRESQLTKTGSVFGEIESEWSGVHSIFERSESVFKKMKTGFT